MTTAATPIVTRTTRDGRTAIVTIETSGHLFAAIAKVHLDGTYYTAGRPEPEVRGPATHVIRRNGKAFGLYAAEAETIIAALRTADEAAATPAARMERLGEQRRLLAARVAGAYDNVQVARERAMSSAYDDPDGDGNALAGMPSYDTDPAVKVAKQVLAAFDAEHPEVDEAIKAERGLGLQTGAVEKELE